MTTQRERLVKLLGNLDHEKTLDLSNEVMRVVVEAQNRPFDGGGADGSLDNDTWEAARNAGRALHDLACKIDRFQKKATRLMVRDLNDLTLNRKATPSDAAFFDWLVGASAYHEAHPDDPGPDPSTASIDELEETLPELPPS